MNLHLDTTLPKKTLVRIGDREFIQELQRPQDQQIVVFIDQCLKTMGLDISGISSLSVNPGPGSFTGTRVGVAVANALGFALKIPVNGHKSPIEVVYDTAPNVTQPKDKN